MQNRMSIWHFLPGPNRFKSVISAHLYTENMFLSPQTPKGYGAPREADEKLRALWVRRVCVDQVKQVHTCTRSHTWLPPALHPLLSVFHTHLNTHLSHTCSTYTLHKPMFSYTHTHAVYTVQMAFIHSDKQTQTHACIHKQRCLRDSEGKGHGWGSAPGKKST